MRHFFLRDRSNFPVSCIATDKKENELTYGLSICNPLDFRSFDFDRARHIAAERLLHFQAGDRYKSKPRKKQKPHFARSKVGTTTFDAGESPKMKLLQTLLADPVFNRKADGALIYPHFLEAINNEIDTLIRKMEQRKRDEAAGN